MSSVNYDNNALLTCDLETSQRTWSVLANCTVVSSWCRAFQHSSQSLITNRNNIRKANTGRIKSWSGIFGMPSSCADIRMKVISGIFENPLWRILGAELAHCLQYSDCVFVHRNKPGDCLRPPLRDTLPTQCQQLQKSYANCRKGWVDMRKRFRGNAPITVSQEVEADSIQTGLHGFIVLP